MKKKSTLNFGKYKLVIKYDENADYYTDIFIELLFPGNRILLYKDNFLALRNIVNINEKDILVLDERIKEECLGILLNEYFKSIFEDKISNSLLINDDGEWIGYKHCIYVGQKYAIWVYKYAQDLIFRVTPIFNNFEKNIDLYWEFINNYNDVFKAKVSYSDLKNIKYTILNLYDKLF